MQNLILRRTTVTDFWIFMNNIFIVKSPIFSLDILGNITGAQSKSLKILENPESWDRKFSWATINIVTWARRSLNVNWRTWAEHDKPISNAQKIIDGVCRHKINISRFTFTLETVYNTITPAPKRAELSNASTAVCCLLIRASPYLRIWQLGDDRRFSKSYCSFGKIKNPGANVDFAFFKIVW